MEVFRMKKLAVALLVSSICLSNAFSAFANVVPSPEEIARWEEEQKKYCAPIAKYEGIAPRALQLIASDVKSVYSGFGSYTYVWGYTDVKDGNKDAYHYTRVEGRENDKVIAEKKVYGTGKVEAETDDIEDGLHRTITARVFWGEK